MIMFATLKRFRLLALALFVLGLALFLMRGTFSTPAAAENATASYIVELNDDPAAVYKARTEKSGGSVSQDQLQAYRTQLTGKQDQFLSALNASGVSYSVIARDVKNFDGSLAATVPLRYTLVYNGLAIRISPAAVNTVKSIPGVKSVHADTMLFTNLNYSVPYTRAPEVYGNYPELTQFDNQR